TDGAWAATGRQIVLATMVLAAVLLHTSDAGHAFEPLVCCQSMMTSVHTSPAPADGLAQTFFLLPPPPTVGALEAMVALETRPMGLSPPLVTLRI
ncbi:MAG: hypothetical protein ACT4P5_09620, partial [Armatimonadota bacterium]